MNEGNAENAVRSKDGSADGDQDSKRSIAAKSEEDSENSEDDDEDNQDDEDKDAAAALGPKDLRRHLLETDDFEQALISAAWFSK